MLRILRFALVAMENLPFLEVTLQLTWAHALVGRFFARLDDVNDREQHAAWRNSGFRRFKQIALQIIADGDEIPDGVLNLVLMLFEIRNLRIDFAGEPTRT